MLWGLDVCPFNSFWEFGLGVSLPLLLRAQNCSVAGSRAGITSASCVTAKSAVKERSTGRASWHSSPLWSSAPSFFRPRLVEPQLEICRQPLFEDERSPCPAEEHGHTELTGLKTFQAPNPPNCLWTALFL